MSENTPPTSFQQIPIRLIKPSPHQARKFFDEENLWKLAESLRQEGLIQPITVRKLLPTAGEREDPGYELVSGERRLRAAKLLNWDTIEARMISVISEGEVAAKGLIENLQREDLNPMEETEGFMQLNTVDPTYWTHERIGQVTGKSRVYITQSLSLMRLPEAIREDVRRRTYSRAHALELARLPGSTLQISVAKMIQDKLTREQTRRLVDSILAGRRNPKMNPSGKMTLGGNPYPTADPLAELWPEFMSNPWITTPGAIKVKYLGNWKWSFEVPGPETVSENLPAYEAKLAVRAWLSKLFTRMGRSLAFEKDAPASTSKE
jgi:ParB/RepB/Spo0J family partition protein